MRRIGGSDPRSESGRLLCYAMLRMLCYAKVWELRTRKLKEDLPGHADEAAQHSTAQHSTAPHRTAPHRAAPRRVA